MQSQNKFFDDLSRLATGAAGTMAGMGREMEARMKEEQLSRQKAEKERCARGCCCGFSCREDFMRP